MENEHVPSRELLVIDVLMRSYLAVERELQTRGLLEVPARPPILHHVVGRTVLLLGDSPELYTALTGDGYKVSTDPEESADTVIVVGQEVSDDDLEALRSQAHYALICHDCGLPMNDDLDPIADTTAVIRKYDLTTDVPRVRCIAETKLRTMVADGWEYLLALEDGTAIRARSQQEFPDGTNVIVVAEALSGTEDGAFALVHGVIEQETEYGLSTRCDVIRSACATGSLTEAVAYSSDAILKELRVRAEFYPQARAALRGFAGTADEAVELLQRSVPNAIEPESPAFDVYLTPGDAANHRATGIVLEPYTPYGPHNIWFTPDTIAELAQIASVESLNHRTPTDLAVTRSFIDETGAWVIECELPEPLYRAVCDGTYTGFSIKGVATVAGQEDN